jgi:protein arginine kinase
MRNLRSHNFPHIASPDELQQILGKVAAAFSPEHGFELLKDLTGSERDYLVGSRLCSPDLAWNSPGRALILDKDRTAGIMVNEEDHVRLQALTAGWSVGTADAVGQSILARLAQQVEFAHSPRFGYLAASPYNAGQGRRLSAMFHLIGLAHAKRLPSVLKALSARHLAARGLFGESSRAVGAFLQISITDGLRSEFIGACEYLIREERDARVEVGNRVLEEKSKQALDYVEASHGITLADALRVLGYARWAATASVKGLERSPRDVDLWLTTLELQGFSDEESATLQRADFLRERLHGGT